MIYDKKQHFVAKKNYRSFIVSLDIDNWSAMDKLPPKGHLQPEVVSEYPVLVIFLNIFLLMK